MIRLHKCSANPILMPKVGIPWENFCVLNPGVIYDEEHSRFVMLYRAAGNDVKHIIRLGLAVSKDGITFERVSDKPVFDVDPNEPDGGCVEDPRIIKIDRYYYITYAARALPAGQYWLTDQKSLDIRRRWLGRQPQTAPAFYRNNNTVTYLACTEDFIHYRRLGRITDSREDDRDVVLFPKKINGRFARITRPARGDDFSMRIAFSDDLVEWEKAEKLYSGTEGWESLKVGAGCPPLETDEGWILIYHGVSKKDGFYRVGALLLDKENPKCVLSRTKHFIMEPEYEYETQGLYQGCVFPTGCVLKDGLLYIYYGCADKFISLATIPLQELLAELKRPENSCAEYSE